MHCSKKIKFTIILIAVLTSLICSTTAVTGKTKSKTVDDYYIEFNKIADGKNRPLKISVSEFSDSVTDSYIVKKGYICSYRFTWDGEGSAKLIIHPLPPIEAPDREIPIENGVLASFDISDIDGYYMVTVQNSGGTILNNFVGELSIAESDSTLTISSNKYIQIAAFDKKSEYLQSIIPIKIEYDNRQLELGFRCDNEINYLTAFVVPADVNDYFSKQDYLSLIKPYTNGIYVDFPFQNDKILKDSVVMISRGFYGSTKFEESQIAAKNTTKKGEYYIYFIAEENRNCALSARLKDNKLEKN